MENVTKETRLFNWIFKALLIVVLCFASYMAGYTVDLITSLRRNKIWFDVDIKSPKGNYHMGLKDTDLYIPIGADSIKIRGSYYQ